jgi:predicted amidohydrolase
MARGFDSDVHSEAEWLAAERYQYAERARLAQINLLLINQLLIDHPSLAYFGGAMVIRNDGSIQHEYPLQREGLLIVEIEPPENQQRA